MSIARLFISGVQKELQVERFAIRDYLKSDALFTKFFVPFLFEDLPASDRNPAKAYLDEVDRCSVYVGVFGNEYGKENEHGISPTEIEFDRSSEKGKYRIVLVKGTDDRKREQKMLRLIRRAEAQLIRRRFTQVPDLIEKLYSSLVQYLAESGKLQTLPFDASPSRARLAEISQEKVHKFLAAARKERNFPLPQTATVKQILEHLNLLEGQTPTNAAVLLFAKQPQRFVNVSEVKCLHFHGTEVHKPIPSYQPFKGTLFDQVDQAVDFVLAKVNRKVTPSDKSPASDVEYEIPLKVVREAIVNAVAHRDYGSNAAVHVHLFSDRLEVRNPGELPAGWTPERLRRTHPSVPRNPLIAEPLYLAHYIEKAGTGTLDMIVLCRETGLPEPEFAEDGNEFVLTIWRDWLTEPVLESLAVSDRQKKAIQYLKTRHRITNAEYQLLLGVAKRTAHRDLDDLVQKNVIVRIGQTGKGTHYRLGKRAGSGPKGSSFTATEKGATKGPKGP